MKKQWMSWLKVRSISKEIKPWRIKRLCSKIKELTNTMIKWNNQSRDMRSVLNKKKMNSKKLFLKEWLEFNRRKTVLKKSTSRKEKQWKILKKISNMLHLSMKENRLFKERNTTIWKDHKKSLLEISNLIMLNFMSKTRSWMKPFQKENLE